MNNPILLKCQNPKCTKPEFSYTPDLINGAKGDTEESNGVTFYTVTVKCPSCGRYGKHKIEEPKA